MFDEEETSNCVTSLICHVPVLITPINSTNTEKQFWRPRSFLKCYFM